MKKHIAFACMALVLLMCAAAYFLPFGTEKTECPEHPKAGRWYFVTPEDAVSSDGSPWRGQMRMGGNNRVMIYLLGGGVSLDEYSAARSFSAAGGEAFYYGRDDGITDVRLKNGVAGSSRDNPFRDWTIVAVPYTTGDFHAGAGDASYTALDGSEARIRHRGYDNCMALMEKVRPYLGAPEALLITGYSAGGFGAAMLAQDIISFFPDTENITVCTDGALLINDDWRRVAEDRWHAPERIAERMITGNLTLDHLAALHAAREDVKILFTCSLRDGGLAKYQSYIDGNAYAPSEEYGDVMQENLRKTVAGLQEQIPGCGVYIWDDVPFAETGTLTKHTILTNDAVFESMEGVSVAGWMLNAVEGRVESFGLGLLEQ